MFNQTTMAKGTFLFIFFVWTKKFTFFASQIMFRFPSVTYQISERIKGIYDSSLHIQSKKYF